MMSCISTWYGRRGTRAAGRPVTIDRVPLSFEFFYERSGFLGQIVYQLSCVEFPTPKCAQLQWLMVASLPEKGVDTLRLVLWTASAGNDRPRRKMSLLH